MARPLPHNKEAEAAVLAGVLLRNEALNDVITLIDEEAFYVPAYKSVFRAMVKLADRGQPIDPVTLEHQLRATDELGLVGGLEGLGKLADRYASSHHVAHHAELVRQTASIRRLVQTASDIADEGREGVEDVNEFIDNAERRLLEVNQAGRIGGYRSAKEIIHGVFENITERAKLKNPITGVPTSFTKLDEMTGGMQPGDLIILAARPSMGKTALALNLAQHACITQTKHQNLPEDERPPRYPTLVFSLEMSAGQLIERILCSEARVDASRLRAGRMVENEFRDLVQAADRLHKAPLFIDDSGAPTILEIRARARRFRQDRQLFPPKDDSGKRKALGLIVVDYLQLCRGGKGRYDSREQEISEISRGLKAIAKELELPVLALSQLNRGVDSRSDHRPQLSDLRESGAIEQDADVIMFIYREARYITDEQERAKVERDAEVIIGKQRNGPTGTVHLVFRGEHTRFENPAIQD
ncbi:replicative DNA helicase [Paraliomyxa miuraensis]|uniref:replicative DNA helicase n=1 Tax=Paraliomyxa miuraensis TaxID=376150 RepID=UPI0022515D34|nr:replicative DNA helicase [Paraliomyxa miuraensis]MCX4240405.1 replicative DNA helicase [Paraliomyxa miuraensis]